MSEIQTPLAYFTLELSDEQKSGFSNPFLKDHLPLPSLENGTENFFSSEFIVGKSYLNEEKTVEYVPGNVPLVIAVPHGGYLLNQEESLQLSEFSSLPIRASGCHEQDIFTQELSRELLIAFQKCSKGLISSSEGTVVPHMIICRAHRSQVDMNRDRENASDNEFGRKAWDDYQHCILRSKLSIVRSKRDKMEKDNEGQENPQKNRNSVGLFLDLHGQSHDPRHQIGYVIRGDILKSKTDSEFDSDPTFVEGSSLYGVSLDKSVQFSQILRGEESLGGMLESEGFSSVPSNKNPNAGEVLYFNGGFCTFYHGSSLLSLEKKKKEAEELNGEYQRLNYGLGTLFSSIQIESGYLGVRDSHSNRQKFAEGLVRVLSKWMDLYLK